MTNKSILEKEWRIKNPERVKAWKKRYYEKNKEYIKGKSKAHYHNIGKIRHKNDPNFKERRKIASRKRLQVWKGLLLLLRNELGGECEHCGYKENVNILQFHHLRDKIENVSMMKSIKRAKEEAKKCILLCPNCHAIETLNSYVV